ncbi:hypothetical protein SAMN06265348_1241, partial [Pedobacter westerhofensis]
RLSGAFATTLGSQVRGSVCTETEGSLLLKYAVDPHKRLFDVAGNRINSAFGATILIYKFQFADVLEHW